MLAERLRNIFLRSWHQDDRIQERTVGECTFSRARGARDDELEEEGLLKGDDLELMSFQQSWKEEKLKSNVPADIAREEVIEDLAYTQCHSLERIVDSWVWHERDNFLSRNVELCKFCNRWQWGLTLVCIVFGFVFALFGFLSMLLLSAIPLWYLRVLFCCTWAITAVYMATKYNIEVRTSFQRSIYVVRGLTLSKENQESIAINLSTTLLSLGAGLGVEESLGWLATRTVRDFITLCAEVPVWKKELGKAWPERRLGFSPTQFEAIALDYEMSRKCSAAALLGSWAFFSPSPLASTMLVLFAFWDQSIFDGTLITGMVFLWGFLASAKSWFELPIFALLGLFLGIHGSIFLALTDRRFFGQTEQKYLLAFFAALLVAGIHHGQADLSIFFRRSLAAVLAWLADVPGGVMRPLSLAGAALGTALESLFSLKSHSEVYTAAGSAAALAGVLRFDSIPIVIALALTTNRPHAVALAATISYYISKYFDTYEWHFLSFIGPRRKRFGNGIYFLPTRQHRENIKHTTAEQMVQSFGRPPILRALGPPTALAAALRTNFVLFPVVSEDNGFCLGTVSRGVLTMLLATDSAVQPSDEAQAFFAPHASPPLKFTAYRSGLLASLLFFNSSTEDFGNDQLIDLRPHCVKAHIVMHDTHASRVSALCQALRTHCIVLRRDQPTEILGIIDRVPISFSVEEAALFSKDIGKLDSNPSKNDAESKSVYQNDPLLWQQEEENNNILPDNDNVYIQPAAPSYNYTAL